MLLQRITTGIIEKFLTVKKNGSLVVEPGALMRNKGLRFFALATTYSTGGAQGTIAIPTKTVTVTLTAAEVLGGLLLSNQGGGAAATYTMPTGTQLQNALNAIYSQGRSSAPAFQVGDGFEFTINNISVNAAEVVTVAGGVGTTAVGNMTIASNQAVANQAWGTFYVQKTGNNTFSFYRVG